MAYTITGGRLETAKKVVLYGPEGIGKSTFAAAFPQPVFIDTEHSTDSMDVARFPHPTDWAMLLGEVRQVRDDPSCCRTLVVDTADWAEKLCARALLARSKKDGIESFGYGKGYVYLGEDFAKLLQLLEEVKTRGVHVVLTAHAALRKFEQPDEMGSYDRWELKLTKQITPLVKEWADLVLFANYKTNRVVTPDGKGKATGGSRVMYTTHHPCWDAKNRYGLPEELPLDFAGIAPLFAGAPAPAAARPRAAKDISAAPDTVPAAPQAPAQAPTGAAAPAQAPAATQAADDRAGATPPAQAPVDPVAQGWQPVPAAAPLETAALEGIAPQLAALLAADGIRPEELQQVVGGKGYFPEDMPVRDYPADFVEGWCLPNWERIKKTVASDRLDLPF